MQDRASNIPVQAAGAGATSSPATIAFDDAVLVDRSKKGDMQAFSALVAKYQDRVLNMICRMCWRRDDAEELAQETFIHAMERLGQFRGQSRFYTWLFRIAANLVITHRRRDGRIKFHSLDAATDCDQEQSLALASQIDQREISPQTAAISQETQSRVARAMEELDDEFRLVIVLRDVEEMDYEQISEVLALPAGTVKSRIHRARCILKDKLADLA